MKKLLFALFIAPIMLLTTGCPVGITYPLGTPGTEKIDKSILGKWGQEPGDDKEILSVQIEKKDDHTLKVTVLERGPLYMEEVDDFNGWFTEINDMQFVYFPNAADANGTYYHYAYKIEGDNLVTYDVSLLDGGTDAVVSTESFREQIKLSMQRPEFLSSKIVWTKL